MNGGQQQADVEVRVHDLETVDRLAVRLFGRRLSPAEWASAVGAMAGSLARVAPSPAAPLAGSAGISVLVSHPWLAEEMERRLYPAGRPVRGGVAICSIICYTSGVSRVIAQRDLRNQNARILAAVEAGASFVVTRNGAPVAELRPLARGRRPFVPRGEIAAVAAAGPRIDAAAFRRDLDATIDQGLRGE